MRRLRLSQLARARILVRTPNWVGDAVMCLPALHSLREALPAADIRLLARPWVADIFTAGKRPWPVMLYDAAGEHRGIKGRLRIASALAKEKFDVALLFQNAFDAALLALLAGIPTRAGYALQGRGPLLTHPADPPRRGETPPHEAHYYLELLRRIGVIERYDPVQTIPFPMRGAGARARLLARLASNTASDEAMNAAAEAGTLIGLSPGASFGTAKRWPAERFAELTRRLHDELGARCIFFGSAQEKPLAEGVIAQAGVPARSLAGATSLSEFIQLVGGCDAYITNDTGTMHVAASLGVPTLAIFGPTNEEETRPLGACVRLIAGEAHCRPCKLRHCPIDHRCMTSVSVERVFEAVCALLHSGERWEDSDSRVNSRAATDVRQPQSGR